MQQLARTASHSGALSREQLDRHSSYRWLFSPSATKLSWASLPVTSRLAFWLWRLGFRNVIESRWMNGMYRKGERGSALAIARAKKMFFFLPPSNPIIIVNFSRRVKWVTCCSHCVASLLLTSIWKNNVVRWYVELSHVRFKVNSVDTKVLFEHKISTLSLLPTSMWDLNGPTSAREWSSAWHDDAVATRSLSSCSRARRIWAP